MGHILLVILKFIGILLASILGLILFLILLVLLAPFGYSAQGEAGEEKKYFQGKISWLFAAILCKVVYSENGLNWYIRIFGIQVAGNSEKFQQKKARKLEKKAEQPKALENKQNQTVSVEPEVVEQQKVIVEQDVSHKQEVAQENASSKNQEKSFTDKLKDFWQKLTGFFKTFKQKLLAIPDKLKKIKENLEEKKAKFDEILEFWREEATQDAKNRLIREGKKVLIHILPKKFRGEVEFGLEDPYVMGQVLAVLGMLMPLYQDKLKVQPDFEEQKLLGKVYLRGRIIPGYLVCIGLVLLLNKNIRKTIKEGKQLIGGN